MKKTVLVFSFIVFTFSLFSQKTLSWKNRDVLDPVSIDSRAAEAEVIIYSSLPLTFNSITKAKDKKAETFKMEKEGPLNVYFFLFSSLPKYSDRKLKIGSNGYKSIEIPLLGLKEHTITAYYVWDEEMEGITGLINEGKRFFREWNYEQAKIKFLDALERVSPEDTENEDTIISYLDKVDVCVFAKEAADKFYNNREWIKARIEYEQVIAENPDDKFCKKRISNCINEFDNTPRTIYGRVTDSSGKALPGVNIVPLENGKKGIRTIADSTGVFQVKTINKTTELIYWKDSMDAEKKIKITGDTINFIAR